MNQIFSYKSRIFAMTILLVLFFSTTHAQVEPFAFNIKEYQGLPSKVAMKRGQQTAQKSMKKFQLTDKEFQALLKQERQSMGMKLASSKSVRHARASAVDHKGLARANSERMRLRKRQKELALARSTAEKRLGQKNLAAAEKEKLLKQQKTLLAQAQRVQSDLARIDTPSSHGGTQIPYQNLTYQLVNPRKEKLRDFNVTIIIKSKNGREETRTGATDKVGNLYLQKIGPLPVTVEIALNQQQVSEWKIKSANQAIALIDHPIGDVKAVRKLEPFRLASMKIVVPLYAANNCFHPAAQNNSKEEITIHEDPRPHIVEMERTVCDLIISAPAGSQVTVAIPDSKPQSVPQNGKLSLRIPLSALGVGSIPLHLLNDLPGGQAETVVREYPHDPYSNNEIKVSDADLHLARLKDVQLPMDVGVMSTRDDVIHSIGEPKKFKGKILSQDEDGGEWWTYPKLGFDLKMRKLPFKKGRNVEIVVERIRLKSQVGGSIGGLKAGTDGTAIEKNLGAPQNPNDTRKTNREDNNLNETVQSYMDNGLRICMKNGSIEWIEIARPTNLLKEGTTAFVPRRPAALYVRSFSVPNDPSQRRSPLTTINNIKSYLSKTNAVKIVERPEDADLILDMKSSFNEKHDKVFGLIPFKYSCSTEIVYSLFDSKGEPFLDGDGLPIKDRTTMGSASADASGTELAALALFVAAVGVKQNNLFKIIEGAGAAALIKKAVDDQHRGLMRGPGASARTALSHLMTQVNHAADYTAQVIDADYTAGRITLNVGKADGVRESTSQDPVEFELLIGGREVPSDETPRKAEYTTAEVIEVKEHTCICEIRKVKREIRGGVESMKGSSNPGYIKNILDPASGLVSVRAGVRFAPIEFVPVPNALMKTKGMNYVMHDTSKTRDIAMMSEASRYDLPIGFELSVIQKKIGFSLFSQTQTERDQSNIPEIIAQFTLLEIDSPKSSTALVKPESGYVGDLYFL